MEFFLSEKLCQDPLESFFGKQSAAGERIDNPTVQQFCHNTISLRVQGSAALDPVTVYVETVGRGLLVLPILMIHHYQKGKDGQTSESNYMT